MTIPHRDHTIEVDVDPTRPLRPGRMPATSPATGAFYACEPPPYLGPLDTQIAELREQVAALTARVAEMEVARRGEDERH